MAKRHPPNAYRREGRSIFDDNGIGFANELTELHPMTNRIARPLAGFVVCVILCLPAVVQPVAAQSLPFDDAVKLFQEKKWIEAASAFEEIEAAQPNQTDALLYQGKCLANLGRFSDADPVLLKYVAVHPKSNDAASLLAYVRFREDKPRDSLQLFTAAAALQTPSPDDLKVVALDYVLLNDFDDAGRYLEIALKMQPSNIEARYHLGRVRYQQNRFDEAIAAFQQVLRLDPSNVKAENNLGLSLEAENQVEPALAAYHRAIDLDRAGPVHTEQPYLNLGVLLGKSNRPTEAVSPLTLAAQIAPKSGKVHYELGKVYFSLNQFENARHELEASVQLDKGSRESHFLLGRTYQRLGKADLAAREFKTTEQLIHSQDAGSAGMSSAPLPGPQ
jgi:tetratricopeptide (TPR) repeat protein